jgi:cytochrome c553
MNRLVLLTTIVAALAAGNVTAGGDPEAGREKSKACAGCHGVDGNSTVGANPRLAGQYESYLLQALRQYKSGQRQNLLMGGMVAALSLQDMKDLAAWYASQDGNTLSVLPRD